MKEPPFTCIVWPVTCPASSLARNTATRAMSSGWAMRPSGTALAMIANKWAGLRSALGKPELAAVRKFFAALQHPFWSFHYTLTAEPTTAEMALVGETRITEILANIVLPWREIRGDDAWSDYNMLPARLTNRRLETGAARLFGGDPRQKRFLRTVAAQQALLQIYEDFCLQDESDCAQCPFPEQMQKWI